MEESSTPPLGMVQNQHLGHPKWCRIFSNQQCEKTFFRCFPFPFFIENGAILILSLDIPPPPRIPVTHQDDDLHF